MMALPCSLDRQCFHHTLWPARFDHARQLEASTVEEPRILRACARAAVGQQRLHQVADSCQTSVTLLVLASGLCVGYQPQGHIITPERIFSLPFDA